jgi:putative flippase GtrA
LGIRRQFLRFTLAGAVGFVVDVGVLYAMLALGLGYYLGRAVSFLAAVFTTWQLNRRYTFVVHPGRHWFVEWMRYLLTMLAGGAVNYACYAGMVHGLPKAAYLPALAVAAGSTAGLTVNFLTARFWVFKERRNAGA